MVSPPLNHMLKFSGYTITISCILYGVYKCSTCKESTIAHREPDAERLQNSADVEFEYE